MPPMNLWTAVMTKHHRLGLTPRQFATKNNAVRNAKKDAMAKIHNDQSLSQWEIKFKFLSVPILMLKTY